MKLSMPRKLALSLGSASLALMQACDLSSAPVGSLSTPLGNPLAITDILLYTGTGVSTSDWQTTETLIRDHGLSYQRVNESGLNAMSLDEIGSFGAIVVPGGKGGTITSALTESTRLNVRHAVQEKGVGYVGFCAGAWIAVGPEAETDAIAGYGLAVAPGSVLSTYWPHQNTSLTADMVPVSLPNGEVRSLVWWGGPSTPEWQSAEFGSGVIGRYETGEPALSQVRSGRGLVVISGPHPEAPQGWRATAGSDPDGLDYDLALSMIDAARNGQWLRL
jgi:glutamine amidotransferase-like uncharacterized protein